MRVAPLDRGRLLGVDPATGRIRWRYPPGPSALSWQHASTTDGGIAIIGDRGTLASAFHEAWWWSGLMVKVPS